MKATRIAIAAFLFLCIATNPGNVANAVGAPRSTIDLRGEIVFIPDATPATNRFSLVTHFKFMLDEQLAAIVALYNDPATPRQVDYAEAYASTGHLLGIAWIDRFGIARAALDFGLIDEESLSISGVLIMVHYGDPV